MRFWQRLTAASRRPAAAARDLHLPGGCPLQGPPQPVRGLAGGLDHRAHHGLEDRRAGALPVLGGDGHRRLRARARRARLPETAPAAHRHRRRRGNGSCATSCGAAAHVSLMGIWCLLAFVKTSDPFVQIFSFSMTLAYMIGISGRNFASNLLVTAQIVCAGIPMTIALFSVGGAYYTIFAFVLVPFFVTLKFISDRLRRVLLDAVVAGRDVSLLAARFDTALNNMPHGLCMFDAERRIAVSNKRLGELLERGARHRRQPGNGARADRRAACAAVRCRASTRSACWRNARAGSRAPATARYSSRPSGRPHAGAHLSPDGRRGRGGPVRGHHRAAHGRGQDQSAGALRCADRPAQPRALPRPDGRRGDEPAPPRAVCHPLRRPRRVQAGQRHAGASLRRRAPVRGGRPAAQRRRAAPTSSPASAATSSWCCSIPWATPRTRPRSPSASSTGLPSPSRSAATRWSSAPASASPWRRATAPTPISCSRTPTWRSTAPSPTDGAPGASSSTAWT